MTVRIIVDDWISGMRTLPDASVQLILTSPPYLGLRAYGTNPQVFGGDVGHDHTWGDESFMRRGNLNEDFNHRWNPSWTEGGKQSDARPRDVSLGAFCPCGAWRGELGSEPTPDLFVQHLVEGFREARRVLRPDGVMCINLGDSYAGSGKGPSGHNGIGDQGRRQGFTGSGFTRQRPPHVAGARGDAWVPAPPGFRQKNLLMIPFRVAMGLQDDGWYLRSVMPWVKRNSMPESVTDRPASAIEYLFLFSKQARYFWDGEAIKASSAPSSVERSHLDRVRMGKTRAYVTGGQDTTTLGDYTSNGRAYRNSDPFFATWQGLWCDEQGDPLALVVNPQPRPGSHYARFPDRLVEPFVKAATSQKGACPACGAPWRRVVERENAVSGRQPGSSAYSRFKQQFSRGGAFTGASSETLGWQPSCSCPPADPVPCVVLDPFGGGGTTGIVADRLGRDAVLIELNPAYAEDARAELEADAGLLFGPPAEITGPVQPALFDEAAG